MSDSKLQGESGAAPDGKDERELSEEDLAKVAGGRGVIAVAGETKGIWVQQGGNNALAGPDTLIVPPVKP